MTKERPERGGYKLLPSINHALTVTLSTKAVYKNTLPDKSPIKEEEKKIPIKAASHVTQKVPANITSGRPNK